MNEAEKKAFAALSEEEQKEVAGGETIDGSKLLTEEQCDQLKKLFKEKSTEDPYKSPLCSPGKLLSYGCPSPSPIYVPQQPFSKRKPPFQGQEPIDTVDQSNMEN